VGKPGVAGVYTNRRLSLSTLWEGPRKICQGFKPDSGNPTVRDYRGALGTVRHGETVTPSRNRKSGNGNPSPTARRARFLSRPRGAKGAGHRRWDLVNRKRDEPDTRCKAVVFMRWHEPDDARGSSPDL
jgi:hypothetical protein